MGFESFSGGGFSNFEDNTESSEQNNLSNEEEIKPVDDNGEDEWKEESFYDKYESRNTDDMTLDEFLDFQLEALDNVGMGPWADAEAKHVRADGILCRVLERLAKESNNPRLLEIAQRFQKIEKWYA